MGKEKIDGGEVKSGRGLSSWTDTGTLASRSRLQKRLPGLDQQWCKHSETGLVKPDCLMYMEISEEAAKKRGGFGEQRTKRPEMQKNVRSLCQFARGLVECGRRGQDD